MGTTISTTAIDDMALSFFMNDPFFSPRHRDPFMDAFLTHRITGFELDHGASATPACDIVETEHDISVRASLPGIKQSDISISHKDSVLTIKADSRSEDNEEREDFHHREIRSGHFSRSMRLPKTADLDSDQLTASLQDGILQITVPKKPMAEAKQITIISPNSSNL